MEEMAAVTVEPLKVDVKTVLELMGMPELIDHFVSQDIDLDDFLNLQAGALPIIFPQPAFKLKTQLSFFTKYVHFMTSNGFSLHNSFQKDAQNNVQPECASSALNVELSDGKNSITNKQSDPAFTISDNSITNKQSDPTFTISDISTSDSEDEESLAIKKKRMERRKAIDQNANIISKESEANTSNEGVRMRARPLVNVSEVGAKRRKRTLADQEIDDLDLEVFLKDNPISGAVISSYEKSNKLTDDDRSVLSSVMIPWLLKLTDLPSQEHYKKLRAKICALFPSEKPSLWYVCPKEEGDHQVYPKGRLFDKIKNAKSKLRKKGYLPPSNRIKSRNLPPPPAAVQYSDEECASVVWLKRNRETFSEVREHWARCSMSRLKELHTNTEMTPHDYVSKWDDILKLPSSYQLVLDDFEKLPLIERYACVEGKSGNLLLNWGGFRERVVDLINHNGIPGLSTKDKKQFLETFSIAKSENDKDYIILSTLPLLCKQRGRVKVGTSTFKPSAAESRDAFLLHVPDAGEFNEVLRKRQKRHTNLKAPLQPFVAIQEDSGIVRASYVIINQVPWKVSSVLQAVDICLKAFFVLNFEYPPEAQHLWLFIQRHLYSISVDGERSVSCVTAFMSELE